MAADSAVMVIDASKGVEAQTRKLFKVCAMRGVPIFTFINKMDREDVYKRQVLRRFSSSYRGYRLRSVLLHEGNARIQGHFVRGQDCCNLRCV